MSGEDVKFYFDYAGSAPPFPEARAAQAEAARSRFANPSAAHAFGRAARAELERLRDRLCALCGFAGGRLVLTSGATEANNWVVHGVMRESGAGRVLVAPDVHASVWNACRRYADRMDVIPLDGTGRIRLPALAAAMRPGLRLVCCSHAASETGVIHDVAAIAAACERSGVMCLIDGTQALGHVPVDLSAIGGDFYVFSAHKFGGPRGCGGAFARTDTARPMMDGGAQEWGLRPGTENVGALAGAVVALEAAIAMLPSETGRLRALADSLVSDLRRHGVPFVVNGNSAEGLPGLVSLSFTGLDGHALVADLALQGFAVATGSACSADRPEPSRAILALGRSAVEATGTIRVSCGRFSEEDAARALAMALAKTVRRLGRPA